MVVTCGATPYLERTLQGIHDQSHAPTRLVVVNIWKQGRDLGTGVDLNALITNIGLDTVTRVRVVAAPDATTFGDAVRQGLELNTQAQQRADKLHETRTGEIPVIREETSPGWVWLLHDDSAPDPHALERQVRRGESGPSIAIVGAKQRDWDQPDRLLEVGIRATATARRFNPIEDDEIDQGQYDHVEDTLAVGLAGALVRRDVWHATGGPDPALGPFGDGLEFSRRVRLAGYRVVVEPSAVVYHARASYQGQRAYGHGRADATEPDVARSYAARRKAQLYNWILATPAWLLPLQLLWLLVLAPLRAVARFTGKDMARARAELSAGAAVLSRPDLWLAGRRRTRKVQRIPAARLAPLESTGKDIRRAKAEQRRSDAETRRIEGAPSELELAEKAALARRRRTVFSLLLVSTTAIAAVTYSGYLNAQALTGGALLPGSQHLADVLRAAFSGWIATGDGYPGPADPFLAVLAVPLVTGMSLSALLKWGLLAALPLAGAAAWFAAGTATRSTAVRALAALLWAFSPVTLLAVAEGRVGAMAVAVFLPLVFGFTAHALGVQRRDVIVSGMVGAQRVTGEVVEEADAPPAAHPARPSLGSAAAAALAFAVVGTAAPALLVVGVPVLLAAGLAGRARRVAWFIPLPALVLSGPWLTAVVQERRWEALLAAPGVQLAVTPAEPWQVALGVPQYSALGLQASAMMLAPGAVMSLLALAALLRGGRRAAAVRVGWALAVIGLALALAAPHVAVGAVDGALVTGWAGHGIALMNAGLLLALAAGADGLRAHLARFKFGLRQVGAALLAVVAVAGAVAGPVLWVYVTPQVRQVATTGAHATPALSRLLASGPERARTLAIYSDGSTLDAQLWRGDGLQYTETSMLVAARALDAEVADVAGLDTVGFDAAGSDLAAAVALLATGSEDAADLLAGHAVGVVLVPSLKDPADVSARRELLGVLGTVPGLSYVTDNEYGAIYRVITDDPDSAASAVTWAQLTAADGSGAFLGAVEDAVPDADGSRLLVVAERADDSWSATLDGVPLGQLTDSWHTAFAVPATGGTVAVSYEPAGRRAWIAADIAVFGAVALLAIPIHRRKEST